MVVVRWWSVNPPYTTVTGKMGILSTVRAELPDELLERNRIVSAALHAGSLAGPWGAVQLGLAYKAGRDAAAVPTSSYFGEPEFVVGFLASTYRIPGGVPGMCIFSGNKMWIGLGVGELLPVIIEALGFLPSSASSAEMCVRVCRQDQVREIRGQLKREGAKSWR